MNACEGHTTNAVGSTSADFGEMSLAVMANDIEATHHAYLRQELPRLIALSGQVAAEQGKRNPQLPQICQIIVALAAELNSHMRKEEQVLFPMIRELETGRRLPAFHCGTLCNPIRQMVSEHDDACGALAQLRELTDDFERPTGASDKFRTLVAALENLEQDLQLHIEKENRTLFPRALALEEKRRLDSLITSYR
jgi:regulator of cell morphogenesis and NO signaling